MSKITKTIEGEVGDFVLYKTGKSPAGKKWSLYEGFIGGEKFKTFDSSYCENLGEKKVFFYTEEEIQGKDRAFTSRTLLPFDSAEELVEDGIPIIEEDPEEECEKEYEKEKEKEMKALEGTDDEILVKIYKVLLAIETILDRE